MPDQPDRSEKQFDPTPQRLKKAREEGNVFKSQEMLSAGLLAGGTAMLFWGAPYAFGHLQMLMRRSFLSAMEAPTNVTALHALIQELTMRVGGILLPLFGVLVALSMGLSVVQTGWNVTTKPLMPKFSQVSPLKGLKRLFSSKSLFQVFKSIVKIIVVGPLAYRAVLTHLDEIMVLHTLPLDVILPEALGWIAVLLAQMIAALLVLAALDFVFEKWKHTQDLKMTKEEVKDETKQNEGDPHVKGKRRQIAQEMARRPRLDHAVMKSDVVVTNPTHYAVALRYDPEAGAAPVVVVKGIRKRALRIKELARELDVPTVEDRPLARALYAQVPEEHEIPEDLYPAVATLLAEIYKQRGTGPGRRPNGE